MAWCCKCELQTKVQEQSRLCTVCGSTDTDWDPPKTPADIARARATRGAKYVVVPKRMSAVRVAKTAVEKEDPAKIRVPLRYPLADEGDPLGTKVNVLAEDRPLREHFPQTADD